jgi:bacteriocin-like protein
MSKDDQQNPTEADRTDEVAPDATEELSDEALENVSGGYYSTQTTTSPWDD